MAELSAISRALQLRQKQFFSTKGQQRLNMATVTAIPQEIMLMTATSGVGF
jgi:hypothetical protein